VSTRLFEFVGGDAGPWRVIANHTLAGQALDAVARVSVMAGGESVTPAGAWSLRGVTSNERYLMREEKNQLVAKQEGLGRPQATMAALIPLRREVDIRMIRDDG
jgi:hypothetical protein